MMKNYPVLSNQLENVKVSSTHEIQRLTDQIEELKKMTENVYKCNIFMIQYKPLRLKIRNMRKRLIRLKALSRNYTKHLTKD
jgi:allophanate hydrolase subunit 1